MDSHAAEVCGGDAGRGRDTHPDPLFAEVFDIGVEEIRFARAGLTGNIDVVAEFEDMQSFLLGHKTK